jgi:hypothetical protein
VRGSRRIEDRHKGPQFFELAVIAFEIVAVQHDRDVRQFMLVAGYAARTRLPQFGKKHVGRAQARLNGRVELSSAQKGSGAAGDGHGLSDCRERKLSPAHFLSIKFNLFKTAAAADG